MEKPTDEEIARDIAVALLSHCVFDTGLSDNTGEKWGQNVGKLYVAILKQVQSVDGQKK
ncbi:MAG TPA: hypothetical protein VGL11_22005 [Candidatus Binatia bacterium]|jgi:hypothetical protein